jgi:hypothetical protein
MLAEGDLRDASAPILVLQAAAIDPARFLERFGRVDAEERSSMRIESLDRRDRNWMHDNVMKEGDDLSLAGIQPALDRLETSPRVDRVECLVGHVPSLSGPQWQRWDDDIGTLALGRHPAQEVAIEKGHIAGDDQAALISSVPKRSCYSSEHPGCSVEIAVDRGWSPGVIAGASAHHETIVDQLAQDAQGSFQQSWPVSIEPE